MIGIRTAARVVLGSLLVAGWIGTAQALPTAQQKCDAARVTAWKLYQACVDSKVAMDAKGITFDYYKAFATCRHAYFKKWAGYQLPKAGLATSTCIGSRFTDNGATVTDNLSGLVWEKKTNDSTVHDKDNFYSWSTGVPPYNGDGTAYATFLTGAGTGLNVAGFAGAKDWRLPTLAELQTIVLDFACTGAGGGPNCSCPSSPCVDPALDAANTQSYYYWSATSYVPSPNDAWNVYFDNGGVNPDLKTLGGSVRAVRGGL
jgi:hypothetical protein